MDIKGFNLSALIWSKYGLPEIITKCGNLKFKLSNYWGQKNRAGFWVPVVGKLQIKYQETQKNQENSMVSTGWCGL